jgi:hypothetical protein
MESSQEPLDVLPALGRWVRGTLVGIALGLALVFAVAAWLNPYDEHGQPRRMETHQQIGLPPCNFYRLTGLPCPSCGMTTSFALLVRGDLGNSLRANAVGTLLAVCWLALIPWSLACALVGRPLLIRSLEWALTLAVIVFLVLLLARWVIVLGLAWWDGRGFSFPHSRGERTGATLQVAQVRTTEPALGARGRDARRSGRAFLRGAWDRGEVRSRRRDDGCTVAALVHGRVAAGRSTRRRL